MKRLAILPGILWASPWTLFGLMLGALGVATGGRYQRTGRVLEFWGGGVRWLLKLSPLAGGAAAITFGHTVLARGFDELQFTRDHERVHVRQYERWGPFFIPAYLGCSAVLWLRGKSPYFDNPFEREAYAEAP